MMKKNSLLVTIVVALMLLMSSVSMAAAPTSVENQSATGISVDQPLANIVALAYGTGLRDGSCGNVPRRDGTGNPNSPGNGGRGR